MSKILAGRTFEWRRPESWVYPISRWIRPYLNEAGLRGLTGLGHQELYVDDSAWLDILESVLDIDRETLTEKLADALGFSSMTVFHGCRTPDAGSYHRLGIGPNSPAELAQLARRIVAEEASFAFLEPSIENDIRNFENIDRDAGRLYVVADDRGLIEDAGHYLLYGSEWLQILFGGVGSRGMRALGGRGVATVLVVEMPLAIASGAERQALAEDLLQEWTRLKVNGVDEVRKIDFSFCLPKAIPPELVVAHFHPAAVVDPYQLRRQVKQRITWCPACEGREQHHFLNAGLLGRRCDRRCAAFSEP